MKAGLGKKDADQAPSMSGIERPRPVLPRQAFGKPGGARAVGAYLPQLTQKAFEKYGFAATTIITDWSQIVGRDLSTYTRPEKLKWPRRDDEAAETPDKSGRQRSGATLLLRVEGPRAVEVQHRGRQIIERINAYFGYEAITELRILQAPVMVFEPSAPRTRGQFQVRSNRQAEDTKSAQLMVQDKIADNGLRSALTQLAEGVLTERRV